MWARRLLFLLFDIMAPAKQKQRVCITQCTASSREVLARRSCEFTGIVLYRLTTTNCAGIPCAVPCHAVPPAEGCCGTIMTGGDTIGFICTDPGWLTTAARATTGCSRCCFRHWRTKAHRNTMPNGTPMPMPIAVLFDVFTPLTVYWMHWLFSQLAPESQQYKDPQAEVPDGHADAGERLDGVGVGVGVGVGFAGVEVPGALLGGLGAPGGE